MRYRAQAPIDDGLMKELGFDGSTLENLVGGVTPKADRPAVIPTPIPGVTAEPIEPK